MEPPLNPVENREHAVVIGASIAGLLAARVLSGYFNRVTVIDRDELPDRPGLRKGAPQSHHVHILLRRGILDLEKLFPGLDAELAGAGAPAMDWAADLAWFTPAGWGPRFPSGLITRACSRALLEFSIRRRVSRLPGVSFIQRCDVTGLDPNESRTHIRAVLLRHRLGGEPQPASLTADLVVDASGRSSRVVEWLARLGYPPPREAVIQSFLGYASRTVRRSPACNPDWKALFIRDRPPFGTRGGVIYPIEQDLWMVNIGGAGQDRPPTAETGFLEFARSLIHPALYNAIQDAEPVSPIYGYQRTENRLRFFERMPNWPRNFIVIGDAVCAFNPVYGQGMTVAAMEALSLHQWLKKEMDGSAFQKMVARVIRTPWLMATTEDVRIPGSQGARPNRATALIQQYFDEVQWLAANDEFIYDSFLQVAQLVKPPQALFHPRIAVKVLQRSIIRRQMEYNNSHYAENTK